jgi:hypothetical protein
VLRLFSSKVSPGRFPETSTFYGRGRREGFGEPPGGNAISCRAAAVECPARPVRTGGPAGPWREAPRPIGDERRSSAAIGPPTEASPSTLTRGNGFGSELRVTSKRGSGLRDGRSPTDLMSLQVATVANWPGGPARDKARSRARGIFPASWPLASVILPHD